MNFTMEFIETNQSFGTSFNENGSSQDGFSPIVDIEKIEGGNRVTITDKEGEKSFDVMDGKDGEDGYTPQKGTDYWTESDKEEIVDDVIKKIPEVESENFEAVYGKTKWADVYDAFVAKKHVYATAGTNVYVLISADPNKMYFSRAQQKSIDYVMIDSQNKWSSSTLRMSEANNVKFADGENLQEKYDNGELGGGGESGMSVNADWSQNDPTAPDFVKNRTHWKETFPTIEWDGSTEGRDSFDASALGFGVLYKVSNEVWTKEQAEHCDVYFVNSNGSKGGSFSFAEILLEDEAVGFAAAYDTRSIVGIIAFFAKQAIDLTSVYGFSIPSAGCYLFFPLGMGWNGGRIVLELPPIIHKLGDEYLPENLLRDGQLNLFPLIQHVTGNEVHAVRLDVDGAVVNCQGIFGEEAETDTRIDDALRKKQASFEVYFGDANNKWKHYHACYVTLEIKMGTSATDYIFYGSCIVKDGDRRIRVNLEISNDLDIYNLWAETLVTKSDYDEIENTVKGLPQNADFINAVISALPIYNGEVEA